MSPIPVDTKESIDRYVEHRVLPGGFLTAVLENDLSGAVARADDTSLAHLREIVAYVHWGIRHDCNGSPEKVSAWLTGGER